METITRIPLNFGPKENFRRGDVIHVPIIAAISVIDDGSIPSSPPVREEIYLYLPSKPTVVII